MSTILLIICLLISNVVVYANEIEGDGLSIENIDGEELLKGEDNIEPSVTPHILRDSDDGIMPTSDPGGFAGGSGTAEDPFQIATAEQMNNVRNDMSAHYVLTNDIDLSGYNNWEPIGSCDFPFHGTFNGNNHTITGLTITNVRGTSYFGEDRYAGFFGICYYPDNDISAVIKNLQIKDASIKISDKENLARVGIILAESNGKILNCEVSGTIDISNYSDIIVGGIAGSCKEIVSCKNNAILQIDSTKVYGGDIICGGICGNPDTISNCFNYGTITVNAGEYLGCGGICGEHGNVNRCVNYGDIIGTTLHHNSIPFGRTKCEVGGIIGLDGGIIENCVNYGDIMGSAPAGSGVSTDQSGCVVSGIAGGFEYDSISNCFNLGKNIDSSQWGARISLYAEKIEECYSLDSVLVNGMIVIENLGSDKPNGANLTEEEMIKRIEALGLDSDEKEDEEETTTKKTIQGAIEHSYGSRTVDTKVEELLSEYVDDWYSAYIDYTCAVEEVLMDSVEASEPTKEQAIKRRKDAMIEADSNSQNREKYISVVFNDDKIKDAAYEGFSKFLYETICSEIDISNISAEDTNETKLINTLIKSVKQASNSKTYKINGIKVAIITTGISSGSFGRITCNDSGLLHTYTICTSISQCQKAISNYLKELMGLTNSAIYQVYSSVCKDVLGVSLDKLTQKYLSQNLTKRISKYTSKLEASGIGNLATNLNSCYNYYQYTKKMMGIIDSKDSPEKILEAMKTYGKFEDSSISDNVVKKAWNELKKAATNLNEAYLSYISGTDSKLGIWWDLVKPKWGKKDTKVKATFSCPVNVFVLNSLGQQIGYAGEDDVWFDSDIIYIEEKGDAKIIYTSSEEPISFNVSATAYGVLGCSIEDYDGIGLPAGRTNYYDIELYPGKNITVSGIKNATDGKVAYTVTSDGQTISANEYIPSTQNAVVSIGCNVINNGTVDGIGSYVRGDAAVLIATPSDNSRFVGWMQGEHLLDTARIYEFTAKENTAITALFADISGASEESGNPNGSSGSNNGSGSSNNNSQRPTDTNETPNHNNQTDNNGTNNENPVFTDVSVNNAPTGTTSPQTGDENTLFILIAIMLIAGGVVAVSITSKKRKRM